MLRLPGHRADGFSHYAGQWDRSHPADVWTFGSALLASTRGWGVPRGPNGSKGSRSWDCASELCVQVTWSILGFGSLKGCSRYVITHWSTNFSMIDIKCRWFCANRPFRSKSQVFRIFPAVLFLQDLLLASAEEGTNAKQLATGTATCQAVITTATDVKMWMAFLLNLCTEKTTGIQWTATSNLRWRLHSAPYSPIINNQSSNQQSQYCFF